MSDLPETKVCPLCAETIKAAARKCPFCQSGQSRFAICGNQLAVVAVGLFSIALTAVVIVFVFPDEEGVGGRSFSGHRSDLVVLNTVLSQANGNSVFWLSGCVTNEGVSPWRVHEFEVRLLDPQDRLLDVRHPEVKEPFVVLPGRDHAFRISLGDLIFTNAEIALQVRVQIASDGDRPMKTE